MQITKQIINNLKMRSRLPEIFNSLRSQLITFKLKTILLICLISFTSLLVRQTLQDAITLSPFYHYKESILWAAGLDYDQQIFLHLTWLIWATVVFSAIALWSYQREQAVQ